MMKRTGMLAAMLLMVLTASAQVDFKTMLQTAPHVVAVEPLENAVYREKYVVRITQNVNGRDESDGSASLWG